MAKGLRKQVVLVVFGIVLCQGAVLFAEPVDLPSPGAKDTCPVCGMFVAKYPEWVATVGYKDGHAHHFDGAKDMFKYLQDLPKWAPDHQASEIDRIGVTEYYGLTLIDAHKAFYVIGSDVLGPMGHELIPLESREDAEEFLQDHHGVSILTFDQVELKLLLNLDQGVFE
jgi:nitrous oxide reductase accessory protein NosL